jgi:ferredoxin
VSMTVTIGKCQGHGNCYLYCPGVFTPDIEGYATVTQPEVPAPLERAVVEAAQACPEHAIVVSDTTGHGG